MRFIETNKKQLKNKKILTVSLDSVNAMFPVKDMCIDREEINGFNPESNEFMIPNPDYESKGGLRKIGSGIILVFPESKECKAAMMQAALQKKIFFVSESCFLLVKRYAVSKIKGEHARFKYVPMNSESVTEPVSEKPSEQSSDDTIKYGIGYGYYSRQFCEASDPIDVMICSDNKEEQDNTIKDLNERKAKYLVLKETMYYRDAWESAFKGTHFENYDSVNY